METRNQAITRYRPSGVIPLELWDLLVIDRILWKLMPDAEFPNILRFSIKMLRRGGGATLTAGLVPEVIAGFDSVHVAGGRAEELRVEPALRTLKLPVTFSRSSDYPGREQGLRLLANMGSANGWVCDLGQTSFKISTRTSHVRFERNFEVLQGRTRATENMREGQRKLLRAWLSESMWRFFAAVGPPDAILFAMPSRLDDAGVPGASSYIGMEGDKTLIADIISSIAGIHPRCILVVNDAELAAMEAQAEEGLQSCKKTLVVTLGFALGAALAMRPVTEKEVRA